MRDCNKIVTVIIPIFNVDGYIKECLNSIITQKYENIEIIIIDDGSTDNSGAFYNEFAKLDNRIIVVFQENKGLTNARNAV